MDLQEEERIIETGFKQLEEVVDDGPIDKYISACKLFDVYYAYCRLGDEINFIKSWPSDVLFYHYLSGDVIANLALHGKDIKTNVDLEVDGFKQSVPIDFDSFSQDMILLMLCANYAASRSPPKGSQLYAAVEYIVDKSKTVWRGTDIISRLEEKVI